jgi:hypothetical protein
MKKTFLTLVCLLAYASISIAGTGIPIFLKDGTTKFTFKQSNNVNFAYYTEATTAAQKYVANAKHSSGDRIYSSSNDTSNIWYKVVAVSEPVTTSAVTNPGESTYDGWLSQ